MVFVVLAIVAMAIVAVGAVWPPTWAPGGWRRMTRPLRRRVRRRHYRQIY